MITTRPADGACNPEGTAEALPVLLEQSEYPTN